MYKKLIDKYAQNSVDNMDLGDLMEIVYDMTVARLEDLPKADGLNEIHDLEPELYEEYKQSHPEKAESFVEEEADRWRESQADAWASEGPQTSPSDMF
jgi:hypothetical protein